ncbi:MAG: arylsulfatase [Mucilaginibacter sp.]
MRNKFLWIIFALVHHAIIFQAAFAQVNKPGKPNIVIILADDMGYGDVSANNPGARTTTPNIDRMAQKSLVFTDAYSGGAVCTPSRYALMTGRYYFRAKQQQQFWGYLPPLIEPGRETIGSLMQRAGYTTACIGKWHLGLNWQKKDNSLPQIPQKKDKTVTNTNFSANITGGPNSLGFDYSFILPGSLDMPPYVFIKNDKVVDTNIILTADVYPKTATGTMPVWDRKYTNENDIYYERGIWWRNGEMSRSFKIENCFDTLVKEGINFINTRAKDHPEKPFMLYLPLSGPHTPWMPNKNFKGKSALGPYGDFIAQVDDVVRQVNEALAAQNIAENTIVIFSSDNGAHWSEEDKQTYAHQANYGKRGQKGDLWDGGQHIPLIVKWPAQIKTKVTYTHTLGLIDLMATLSELTGIPVRENNGEDSFSFYKVIKGQLNVPVRDDLIFISSHNKLAIKQGNWKYAECLGSAGISEPPIILPVKGGPLGQLYDLSTDPLETNNLYLQNSAKVKELAALLEKIKAQGYSNATVIK